LRTGLPLRYARYPGPNEFCEGVVGMNIAEGDFEGTDLSGLKWAVTVHWPKALHDGNGTAVVYIDESADEAQREAIGTILSGEAGGPLFEILSSIITTVHGPHYVPIEWEFDQDDEQRIAVRMPGAFEYKEAEVGQATLLTSSTEIKFDWKGTHSSLAQVEHTNEALVA
jgi:hypothetical protein